MILAGKRTNVTIYTCIQCTSDYKPKVGENITFTDEKWEVLTTLMLEVIDQTVHLNPPRKTNLVALARYGFINVAEIEIYQHPCKLKYI